MTTDHSATSRALEQDRTVPSCNVSYSKDNLQKEGVTRPSIHDMDEASRHYRQLFLAQSQAHLPATTWASEEVFNFEIFSNQLRSH